MKINITNNAVHSLKGLVFTAVAFAAIFALVGVVPAQFNDPACDPPGCNAYPPINEGPDEQIKEGKLVVQAEIESNTGLRVKLDPGDSLFGDLQVKGTTNSDLLAVWGGSSFLGNIDLGNNTGVAPNLNLSGSSAIFVEDLMSMGAEPTPLCADSLGKIVQCANPTSGSGSGGEIFDTAGTYTWTPPAGVDYIELVVVGAGGGGAPGLSHDSCPNPFLSPNVAPPTSGSNGGLSQFGLPNSNFPDIAQGGFGGTIANCLASGGVDSPTQGLGGDVGIFSTATGSSMLSGLGLEDGQNATQLHGGYG